MQREAAAPDALAEAYLRDGGWLNVLERTQDGLEKWTRCYGVINVGTQVFEVSEAPLADAERLFAGPVRAVRYESGSKTFEVTFAPHDQVAEFRCTRNAIAHAHTHGGGKGVFHDDVVAAASWAMSLRALIDESRIPPSKLLPALRATTSTTLDRAPRLHENDTNTNMLSQTGKNKHIHPDEHEAHDAFPWPPRPRTLPWCGYMLVLAEPVSQKWRETFIVLGPDAIAELSAPARGAVLFLWKNDPEAPTHVRLARPRANGPLEVHLVSCEPAFLSTDDPTPATDEVCLRMISQTDELTFAWAHALRTWLTAQETSSCITAPIRWTVASSVARHCASQVLLHGGWGDEAAQNAASALACTIDGPHLVHVSREPYKFRLRSLLQDRLPTDAATLLRGLTARIERVGAPKARMRLDCLGLDLAEAAAIVHDKAMDFHVKPFFRQAAHYRLHVHYRGHAVYGSPLRVKADPGPPSPSHCTIGDLRVKRVDDKKLCVVQFTVSRRDALLNLLTNANAPFEHVFQVQMAPESSGKVVDVRHAEMAQCTAHLAVPSDAQEVKVEVTLAGHPVRDSPFLIRLQSRQDTDASAIGEDPQTVTKGPSEASFYRDLLQTLSLTSPTRGPAPSNSREEHKTRQAPLGAMPSTSNLVALEKAYAQLAATLAPLAQVARIERLDAAPSAQWKRLLNREPYLPILQETPVDQVLEQLRELSIAFSKSMLPNRHVLVQQIDALVQALGALLQPHRNNSSSSTFRSAYHHQP
ncbi:Hypothetical Protein FCC1311_011382 [Hondaea fermentalgiana]|uniref:PH domain-containing protein n=1 Tax=Hondaea fermentalgiana TaxID=2315210 RepID=A0A2R5GA05_9STRA|nr:Hypothetical Protein FCC1311_011382 [Hondaea fermentalgiana]|eukprot:GBG24921.1 Hypothetical Protein FCC1311_011382 [Hondaea fermentalgiana]